MIRNPIRDEVVTLCDSCRWSGVIQFHGRNHKTIRCDQFGREVFNRVESCTYFVAKNRQTLHEMNMAAWLVKGSGAVIGFIRPGTKEHDEALSMRQPEPAK